MSTLQKRTIFGVITIALLLCVLCATRALGQAQNGQAQSGQTQNDPQNTRTASATADAAKSSPSAADIAAAKAAGKVWVNLGTGVYHKSGRWYGKTKNGKFMTESEAKKAGYREARRD